MDLLFKKSKTFAVVFFAILLLDIIVKHTLPAFPYRYFSKPLVVLLLLAFYIINTQEKFKFRRILVVCALLLFLAGDLSLIKGNFDNIFLIIGISFFVLGKAFYCFRFLHSKEFKIRRLLPFFVICFLLVITLLFLIFDNLGEMMIPVLIYFFIALMMLLLAYLRKDVVNKTSYKLVLLGAVISIFSDSVTAIKEFYIDIPYQEIMIMLFYGISQYLIITGLVIEKNQDLKLQV